MLLARVLLPIADIYHIVAGLFILESLNVPAPSIKGRLSFFKELVSLVNGGNAGNGAGLVV